MIDSLHLIADKKQKAIALFFDGYLMDAKALCGELIATDHQDAETFCVLGAIHGKLGNFEKAIKYSRKAVDLQPSYMPAYFNLILALRQIGDLSSLQEAVRHLQTMIKQNDQHYETHYNLGYVFEQLGQYEEAIQSYRKTYQLDPSYIDAYVGEASVYEKLSDADTAYEKIHPFLNERPLNPGIVNLYGKIAAKLQLNENAIELMEQLLDEETMDSDDIMRTHFTLGSLYDKLGQFDDAFLHF